MAGAKRVPSDPPSPNQASASMTVLENLSISRKITAVFAVVVALVALSGAVTFHLSGVIADAADRQAQSGRLVFAAKDALASAVDLSSHLRGLVMTRIAGNATDIGKDQERFEARVSDARRFANLHPDLAAQIDALDAAERLWRHDVVDVVMPLAMSAATADQATALMTTDQNRARVGDIRAAAARVQATAQAVADATAASHAQALFGMRAASLVTTLLVALAAAGLSWLLSRLIGSPVVALTASMRGLAEGDRDVVVTGAERRDEIGAMAASLEVFRAAAIEKLRLEEDARAAGRLTEAERARNAAVLAEAAERQTRVVAAVASGLSRLSAGELAFRIAEAFPADYERLRADFNAAMEKLQDTMRTVTVSASAILSGTGEISTAADDLSRRTEQQAASLEETAAALDEITATVRRTADGSRHARSVVGHARGSAEDSGRIVHQAVEAMSGIERSAREITQIIGVIDEIAFQTNLLALNAGVEAARAGDAGRGFAVVASEVRALAQRSAEAAKEIKGLISTSGRQVEQGVAFVGQTGKALASIVAQVAEIDGIVGEIAASAQEQASALDEVNTAVNQMDQVTQQNAAMVEETTAASHNLAAEAGELSRLIGEFRLGDPVASPGRADPARPGSRPLAAPVRALRTFGRGGAARAPAPMPETAMESWAEF